jgi:DNA-binding HxlR family transcriptional regulator
MHRDSLTADIVRSMSAKYAQRRSVTDLAAQHAAPRPRVLAVLERLEEDGYVHNQRFGYVPTDEEQVWNLTSAGNVLRNGLL